MSSLNPDYSDAGIAWTDRGGLFGSI